MQRNHLTRQSCRIAVGALTYGLAVAAPAALRPPTLTLGGAATPAPEARLERRWL
jgi:hypothetical protein